MKQLNRKPLFLGLALTLAAPIAFAQTTYPQSSTQSTDSQSTTQPTQSQDTQSSTQPTTTQSTDTQSTATQSTDTQSAAQSATGTTDATAGTSTTGAQKRNWSDLDLDKNGSLSSTEAAPISSLSQSFATADANADGELTQDEYKAFLASSGKDKAPGSDK